jgi:hypothetical protein
MRLESRVATILAAALSISGCEMPPEGGVLATSTLAAADQAIAARLYTGTPRTPAGFLDDPAPSGFAQVTTYHVKTSQLAAPTSPSHEVCSDDWSQAFAWSEEVAAGSSPYLDFVGNVATDRYFEFDRVPRGLTDRYVRMRVFRCAYLDRTGVDSTSAAGFGGMLNAGPIDATALRELSEYLWRFTPYNNAGHAVLASEPRNGTELGHALTIASLERGADGSCDRVVLHDSLLTVDLFTGALHRGTAFVREFGVRQQGGLLIGC